MSAPTEEATVSSLRATVTCLNKVAAYLSFLAGVSWLGLWLFGAPGNSYLSLSIAVVFLCNGYIFMLGSQKKAARKVE